MIAFRNAIVLIEFQMVDGYMEEKVENSMKNAVNKGR